MSKNSNLPLLLLLISDVIILLLNLVIFVISLLIIINENSLSLFLFQFIESILMIVLNLIMAIKILVSKYKGHNNYGMFIRFLIFYLSLSCALLTFQRCNNINTKEIKKLGNLLFVVGLFNNLIILISMILSFIVNDKKSFSKTKKEEDEKIFNINSLETMEILEPEKSIGSMSELVQRRK